ncbi:MAG: hypothetical protein H9802_09845 [Candidatus Phocaeicola faecipullorum]|nr:hypothetical protein [Candidatus Phocaeicola faecipullorum]
MLKLQSRTIALAGILPCLMQESEKVWMLDDGFEIFFQKKLLKNLDNKNKVRNFANAFASKREQVL